MRAYVREQKHICGKEYMEVDLFEVSETQHKVNGRRKRMLATSIAQQKYNHKLAVRYFVQMVHTNFGRKDFALTLTYDDAHKPEPGEDKKADRDWSNFVTRVNRYCDKHGKPHPKWVVVTEYAEADETGKVHGRTHHHAIIEGVLTRDEYEMLWRDRAGEKIGFVRCEKIDVDHGSFEGLVRYMTKNERYTRRWRQSRGLKRPKTPRPNDSRWNRKKLDEAFRIRVDDRTFWQQKYPGYTLNECVQEVTGAGTLHLVVKMRALPGGTKKKRGKE